MTLSLGMQVLEQDILQQAAEHARTAHNMTEIPPEVVDKVRGAIRDEAA
jgi:predicted small metal-binding protein